MRVLVSWLREFVDVAASPAELADVLTMRGFEVASLDAPPEGALSPAGHPSPDRGPDLTTGTATDAVIDLEITANRPDCLSVVGIAREVATAYALPLKRAPSLKAGSPTGENGDAGGPTGENGDAGGPTGENGDAGSPIAENGDAGGPRGKNGDGEGPQAHARADERAGGAGEGVSRWDPRSSDRGRTAESADGLTVLLEDPDRCPRYAAAVVDVGIGPSPEWLANRLNAAGVRPINNVVDATNYVMLELGQPLHAFDLMRLSGQTLRIRTARAGEQIRTLDGELRTLDPDMLVIADAENAQAIAGVMGGATSEVWGGTRTIALESAYFNPASVRRTSKRVGLKTEASARFERGANIDAPTAALERVVALIESIGAGRRRGNAVDCYPSPRTPAHVGLRRERIAHLLGRGVPDDDVDRILSGLGLSPERTAEGWRTTVPGWRVDIAREADLIEEVGRHFGYDQIPATFPPLAALTAGSDPRIARDALVRRVLTASGFSEAITFVFVEAPAARPFAPAEEPVALAYPLSEKFAVLRPSLLPGLVESIAYNRRRERRDVRLFEIGSTFSAGQGERRAVAFAWSGGASMEHWSGGARTADFFDAKGVVENVCGALRTSVRYIPSDTPYLVEGRRAAVLSDGAVVGVVGQLSPAIAEARGFPPAEEIYVAELDLERLPQREPTDLESQAPPRFPSVVRDLSILVAQTLPAEAVRGTIVAAAPDTLVAVREFDRYQGKGIPEDRVSLSFHLTFRAPERTLTDAEVQQAMDGLVEALRREHGAIRR